MSLVGLDQAPGEVELGLERDVFAFLFVLRAEDAELGGFQWAVRGREGGVVIMRCTGVALLFGNGEMRTFRHQPRLVARDQG